MDCGGMTPLSLHRKNFPAVSSIHRATKAESCFRSPNVRFMIPMRVQSWRSKLPLSRSASILAGVLGNALLALLALVLYPLVWLLLLARERSVVVTKEPPVLVVAGWGFPPARKASQLGR